jgi:mono/diheme cytochrome c family protein
MPENPKVAAARFRFLFARHATPVPAFALASAILAIIMAAVVAPAAQAQSDDRVKEGLAVWRNSGCADCHGAFANGEKQRDEMPAGANLRTTKLDAASLKDTISCGRPGTGMPSFDEDAWKVRPCNGQTPGVLPSYMFPAPVNLTPDEIDAVVSYLQARVIGKGPTITKEECLSYYTDDPGFCDDYKE